MIISDLQYIETVDNSEEVQGGWGLDLSVALADASAVAAGGDINIALTDTNTVALPGLAASSSSSAAVSASYPKYKKDYKKDYKHYKY